MLLALDRGYTNGDYAFIAVDINKGNRGSLLHHTILSSSSSKAVIYGANTWMGDDGRDADAARAMQGVLNVHLLKSTSDEYQAFERQVRYQNTLDPFFFPAIPEDEPVYVLCLSLV
jgi:hypothetical protein